MWSCDPYGPHQFDARKLLFHENRVTAALQQGVSRPIVFELSPSDACNQRCHYCVSMGFRKRPLLMERDLLLSTVRQIAKTAKAVTFVGGGEPLTHPDCMDAMFLSKQLGLDVGLITNGTLIREKDYERLVSDCTFIRVSLDTVDPREYALNRGSSISQYQQVMHNLKSLAATRAKSREALLGAQLVWYGQSKESLRQAVACLGDLGIDFVQIRPVDRAPSQGFEPDWSRYEGAIEFLHSLIESYSNPRFRVIPSLWKFSDALDILNNHGRIYNGCPGGNFTCAIGADARVYYCCSQMGNSRFAIGDLRLSPLEEVLASLDRARIVRECDFSDCQAFCRNHEINKIFHKLQCASPEDAIEEIRKSRPESVPLHVNFL